MILAAASPHWWSALFTSFAVSVHAIFSSLFPSSRGYSRAPEEGARKRARKSFRALAKTKHASPNQVKFNCGLAHPSPLGRPPAIATGADRREVRYRGRAALPHNFGRNFGRKRSLLSPCILTNLLPLKRQRLLVVTCHKLSGRNCSSKLCVCATNSSNLLETFEQRISRYVSSWYPLCPICQTAGRHSPPPYNCSLGGTKFSSARRSRDSARGRGANSEHSRLHGHHLGDG